MVLIGDEGPLIWNLFCWSSILKQAKQQKQRNEVPPRTNLVLEIGRNYLGYVY